jgi:hypothetical protein
MDDTEQKRRERAYKIWEEEGRVDGAHDDHWRRAGSEDEETASDVTDANREASEKFNGGKTDNRSAADVRPPSTVAPD